MPSEPALAVFRAVRTLTLGPPQGAAAVLVASCTFSGPPAVPTPTPDRPALTGPQVLQLVLQRIPSPTNRQAVREYARLEYLGRGEWLVQYGSEAAWLVRERESQVEPLDEWARSLEQQIRSED